jgi:hypothetical protein
MTAPGSTSSQRASTGLSPTPLLRAGPHNPRVAGAGAGNPLHLTDDETDAIAADLDSCWSGITGLPAAPAPQMLRVLVERTLRKARETIASRPDKDF